MTVFVVAAVVLTAFALAAVLLPLLRKPQAADAAEAKELSLRVLREQLGELEREVREGTLEKAQYQAECAEIERRAIEDVRADTAAAPVQDRRRMALAAGTAVAVCAVAVGLYLKLGTPDAFRATDGHAGGQQSSHALSPQQIQGMVARLAEKLQENPADGEGWLMLARSYNALGRYPEASAAYGRAFSILPPDAQHLSDYADTLAMAQGRSLAGEPEKIIARALQADPNNVKALALAGSAAFERQDFQGAIGQWRKILAVVPPGSPIIERINGSIADAEARMGGGASPVPAADAAPAAGAIRGIVALDSSLRGDVGDNDTVFVFARAVSGPRMPLAIKRMTVRELPARFVLDDSMSMAGGPKLSSQTQVVLGARVSKSGNATPQPGDLEGLTEPVVPGGAAEARITISRKLP